MAGERALRSAVDAFVAELGSRLLAAYALGSLAHGGFSELVSDIDLGLILSDPIRPEDADLIDAIAERVRSGGSPLNARLSVFWGTPSTLRGELEGGRFPALDRLDLIEHGRLMAGCDDARRGLAQPDQAELLIAGARFALERLAKELLLPEQLLAGGVRKVTKTVLFPVRFLFTAKTGRVAPNDDAVKSYLAENDVPGQALVAAAREWRMGSRGWETDAAELLAEQLVPLYLHYVEDHLMRLRQLGEPELAHGFEEWRKRLLERVAHTQQQRRPGPKPGDGRTALSWSGGKDSALALWALRRQGIEPSALITTVTDAYDRISMHGVRRQLLAAQAASLGIPLVEVNIPPACVNEVYEARMAMAFQQSPLAEVEAVAFGDLFLEDIRAYREQRLQASGRDGIFPLWGLDTSMLAREFVAAGFEAYIVCLDPNRLSASFAGRRYDEDLLCELPSEVDPCGENGEFHTFVHAGPIFSEPIDCRRGEIVEREGFVFCDLVPI